jgi:hypothetical protein
MQIFVSVPSGRTITLDVDKEDSVSILRNKIEAKEGLVADLQRLVFAGVQLEDGKTLSDCNIGKEDTIIAVLRLLGGRGHGLVETTIDVEQLQDAHCRQDDGAAGASPAARTSEEVEDPVNFLDDDIFADLPSSSTLFNPTLAGGLPSFSRQTSLQWDQSDTAFWAVIDSAMSAAEESDASTQLAAASPVADTLEVEEMQVEPTPTTNVEVKVIDALQSKKAKTTPISKPARSTSRAKLAAEPANPKLIQKSNKGLSYNLEEVDDKLRKRLLKNRQSAERSRQRKNLERKNLEEQLEKVTAENASLRGELERFRALLLQHGISH